MDDNIKGMNDKNNVQPYQYETVALSEEESKARNGGYVNVKIHENSDELLSRDSSIVKDMGLQLLAVVTGTLMAISDGMQYGWTSPMVPYFLSNQTHITITKADGEWMETIQLLGAAAGLPLTIWGVEYLGRKKSMILSALMGCVCWIIILFTNQLGWIFVARFFSGTAGDMCFVAAPMYIAEIADHRIRGFFSALIYLMMLIGVLTVYTAGALTPYYVVPCIGIVLTLCQCIFFPFMPESPYYFVYKNQIDNAEKSLRRLRSNPNIDKEIYEIKMAVERQKTEKSRPQDLILIRSNRYAVVIMVILNGSQHFVGISVILMNLHLILQEAGSVYIQPSTAAIIFASVMLVSATIASAIIDRFGRKILLIFSGVSTGFTLLIMSVFFNLKYLEYDVITVSWIPAACVMVYAFTFKIGLGLVPIVVTAEIFPTTIKAIGMTLADVVYVFAGIISISMYSALFENYGIHVPFYVFSFCSFCTVFFSVFIIPETKGKTLEEIQFKLKRKNVKNTKQDIDLKT